MITSQKRVLLRFCRDRKITRKTAAAYTEISIPTLIRMNYPAFSPLDKFEDKVRELIKTNNKKKIAEILGIKYHKLTNYCSRKKIK